MFRLRISVVWAVKKEVLKCFVEKQTALTLRAEREDCN